VEKEKKLARQSEAIVLGIGIDRIKSPAVKAYTGLLLQLLVKSSNYCLILNQVLNPNDLSIGYPSHSIQFTRHHKKIKIEITTSFKMDGSMVLIYKS